MVVVVVVVVMVVVVMVAAPPPRTGGQRGTARRDEPTGRVAPVDRPEAGRLDLHELLRLRHRHQPAAGWLLVPDRSGRCAAPPTAPHHKHTASEPMHRDQQTPTALPTAPHKRRDEMSDRVVISLVPY